MEDGEAYRHTNIRFYIEGLLLYDPYTDLEAVWL